MKKSLKIPIQNLFKKLMNKLGYTVEYAIRQQQFMEPRFIISIQRKTNERREKQVSR